LTDNLTTPTVLGWPPDDQLTMPTDHLTIDATCRDLARRTRTRADAIATFTEEPGKITRPLATPAMVAATARVEEWMRAAGMETRVDAIGNLVGRWAPAGAGAGTLVIGSHLDSVADAGRYDGVLGVLAGLAVVEGLRERGAEPPFAIEVVAFADEEGLRFQSTLLGSRAFTGRLDEAELTVRDAEGTALADALRAAGGDPDRLAEAARDPADLLGWFEVHIEQGPVLEARDLPLGVVSAIAGQNRFRVAFAGLAGHAGTVPMDLRRDALAAAAEFVLAAERVARAEPGLVATVGQIAVPDGAVNVVPGRAEVTLDIRHQDDEVRRAAIARLRAQTGETAAARGVTVTWEPIAEHAATPCSPRLRGLVAEAVAALGVPVHALPSGAGHDAVALAEIAPVAMLFVRCKDGISHHPAESVREDDVALAIAAAIGFVERLAAER
jgi:allantoate deiminase